MIIDFRSQDADAKRLAHRFMGWRCFIDDNEVRQVWYVDTLAGFVRSYNVMGDDKAHAAYEALGWPPEAELIGEHGVLSITVRGVLRMEPPGAPRAGFKEIVAGWPLIDGLEDLTNRIERAAVWSQENGGLNKDEEKMVRLMIECQMARGLAAPQLASRDGNDEAQCG